MMKKHFLKVYLGALTVFFLLTSCNAFKTAAFNQQAYQKGTEIKVDASKLMDKATMEYSSQEVAIEALLTDVEKMVEYEKNRPNNEVSYAMWKILADPNKKFIGGFFKRWKEKGTLSSFFAEEAKKQSMEALDLLLQFEGKKDQKAATALQGLINAN